MPRPKHLTWKKAPATCLTAGDRLPHAVGTAPHREAGWTRLVWGASAPLAVSVYSSARHGCQCDRCGQFPTTKTGTRPSASAPRLGAQRKDLTLLGPAAHRPMVGIQTTILRIPQVRQAILGTYWQAGCRIVFDIRASPPSPFPVLRREARRPWSVILAPARPASTSPWMPAFLGMRQKARQGSHFAHTEAGTAPRTSLVITGVFDPGDVGSLSLGPGSRRAQRSRSRHKAPARQTWPSSSRSPKPGLRTVEDVLEVVTGADVSRATGQPFKQKSRFPEEPAFFRYLGYPGPLSVRRWSRPRPRRRLTKLSTALLQRVREPAVPGKDFLCNGSSLKCRVRHVP